MKKTSLFTLLAISLFAFCSGGFAADFKIATVDLRKVFDNYYKTIAASAANSNNIVAQEKEYRSMVDDYRKRQEDLQQAVAKANDQSLSPEERAKHKTAADDIHLDLQIRGETITNYLVRTESQRREEMVQHIKTLTAEIRGVMEAMAKKQGYTLVLDRTAETMTGNPVVLYTSGENDLTEALLKELNLGAPAAPVPEADSPAGAKPPPKH
jgi:Skp family chaperone for outer membrane proteins